MKTVPNYHEINYPGSPPEPEILKRKIISYPLTFSTKKNTTDIESIREEKKKYDTLVDAQSALDEIADFEKRVFGKERNAPKLDIKPVDPTRLEQLKEFDPPSIERCYDVYSRTQSCPPTSKNSPRMTKSRNVSKVNDSFSVINSESLRTHSKPSSWNLLDQPIVLSKGSIATTFKPPNPKPFIPTTGADHKRGIPIYSRKMEKEHEQKVQQFNNSVRYQMTLDNQIRENRIKAIVKSNMEQNKEKRTKTKQQYHSAGQGWALEKIDMKKRQTDNLEQNQHITEEDLEAYDAMKKREEELFSLYKESKKNTVASPSTKL